MRSKIPAPAPSRSRVSLKVGASTTDAREAVLLPWVQSAAAASWQQGEPTLIVVPFRSYAYTIKSFLLDRGISLLGLRFVSPAELRELLSLKSEARLPLREHLRLLLSIAAEECMNLPSDPIQRNTRMLEADFLAAKSVARAPDHLLRAIDQLGAAGWSFAAAGLPALRDLEERFQQHVGACGFELIHSADRRAVAQAQKRAPLFANLLVAGFNGAYWALWPLLRAGVTAAKKATVILEDPREEAREIDESWIGTWEQTFGAAETIAAVEQNAREPFANLFSFAKSEADRERRGGEPFSNFHFLVGKDQTEQARAIVAMTIKFLRESSCTRLGILFAGPGTLPRLVAAQLSDFGIAHDDGIAHLTPGPFENAAWQAWLSLQENPQLSVLLAFLNALEKRPVLFGDLASKTIEDILRAAYQEVLIDDLALLREACSRSDRPDSIKVAHGLANLKFLPSRSTLGNFLPETEKIFAQLGWTDRWAEIERLSQGWSDALNVEFSRPIYLRWLSEIASSFYATRDPEGNHPYSRVHLLPAAQAEGEHWSHLILAGLNEGEWPRDETGSGFLREEEIETLNRRIKILNKEALQQGDQGEGHWSVREGYGICLGPLEQRQIALRQFANILESVECAIAMTASLSQESEPDRSWNPSEFFSRLYFGARGKALSARIFVALHKETCLWLGDSGLFVREDSAENESVQQTRIAYDARRRPRQPAGEYEFALRTPLPRMPVLRVTQWEKVLSSPALIWMKAFLEAEAREESGDAWSAATGRWVHRWLAKISAASGRNQFAEMPAPAEIRDRVRDEAHRFHAQVEALCAICQRALPDWWTSGWSNAFYLAERLAEAIATLQGWPRMATEFSPGSPLRISLSETEQFPIRGRIDLLLAREENEKTALGADEIWVIDYKTGRKKNLVSSNWKNTDDRMAGVRKRLLCGDLVQLGLYALAVRELGAEKISLSLLSPAPGPLQPQLDLADIEAHLDFWLELHRMQQTGIFGMLGEVRSEWSFNSAYPLATLGIDPDLLQEKWAATHPAFAASSAEDDS